MVDDILSNKIQFLRDRLEVVKANVGEYSSDFLEAGILGWQRCFFAVIGFLHAGDQQRPTQPMIKSPNTPRSGVRKCDSKSWCFVKVFVTESKGLRLAAVRWKAEAYINVVGRREDMGSITATVNDAFG